MEKYCLALSPKGRKPNNDVQLAVFWYHTILPTSLPHTVDFIHAQKLEIGWSVLKNGEWIVGHILMVKKK
jgi:hypothetical protein